MKKTAVTLALFTLLAMTLSAQTQKIAVVNPMLVLEQSNPGKAIVAELQTMGKEIEQRGNAMLVEINNLKKELNSPALNNEAREKKMALLATKETNVKRYSEDSQREFAEKRNKAFQKLQEDVLPIIQEIRKQKGLSIVFDLGSAGITAYDEAIDISKDVVEAYNAKHTAKK